MYSVLYVDDEPDLLEIAKLFLEQTGEFVVDTRISAHEALVSLKSAGYDAIISDYQMPGMDGIAFLREVRAVFGSLPFILFTGRGREEVVIEAINNGVDFYLQKGGDPRSQFAELSHKVRKAVEIRRVSGALQKNEERLRFALEGANDGIWDVNLATGEFYLSPRGCAIIGYAPGEIAGVARTWNELINPDDLPPTNNALAAYLEGKTEIFSAEQRLKTKSGSWKWVLSRGKVVGRDEKGNPLRMTGTHTDITDRKSAEDELRGAYEQIAAAEEELRAQYGELKENHDRIRLSEERLRRAEVVARTGHWEIHVDTKTMVASDGALAIYGVSESASPLSEIQKIPLPEYRATLDAALHALITECKPYDVEFTIQRPSDGMFRDIHSVAVYDPDRRVVLGIIHDITERKLFLEQLRESEQKFAAVFRSSPLLIAMTELDTQRIVDVNHEFEAWIGYSRDELLGRSFLEIFRWESQSQRDEIVTELTKGRIVRGRRVRFRTSNGEMRDVDFSARIIEANGKKNILSMGYDITAI
ncbi:PAS domain S-box protein [uncultured Methanoregula sp.]|uniref:response regulator n=1 Tax=uncultured Methanoregula sp. TaxID=1005933 RepID=UPI002AAAEA09|nr:PAS domain S-box protein [uncultured Methanoregula sp.]